MSYNKLQTPRGIEDIMKNLSSIAKRAHQIAKLLRSLDASLIYALALKVGMTQSWAEFKSPEQKMNQVKINVSVDGLNRPWINIQKGLNSASANHYGLRYYRDNGGKFEQIELTEEEMEVVATAINTARGFDVNNRLYISRKNPQTSFAVRGELPVALTDSQAKKINDLMNEVGVN